MRHNSHLLMIVGILLLIGAYVTANAALGRIESDVWNVGLATPLVLFFFGTRLVLGWDNGK